MEIRFSTSWIVQGWITCVLVSFYAQNVFSKSSSVCDEKHYLKNSRCCKKCEPGFHVFSHCTDSHGTVCVKCNRGEYQPGLTEKTRCLQQKFCDPIKGFMERPENTVAEEPCRCFPGLHCSPINCEYCERIPTCSAGHGLELDSESTRGRKKCVACQKGFFSAGNNAEPCKQWTNCKAEGRSETHPGSAKADAVCGLLVSGAAPSWVIVSVLSAITVLCLVILLLFCYKDKLKLISVNLRTCVQNLKRTRIQQETLAPLYHSGVGGGPGGPRCSPCETTKLISQTPLSTTNETPCTFPASVPDVKISLISEGMAKTSEEEGTKEKIVVEEQSQGSGEPEEVSEKEEVISGSPLSAGSCMCIIPVREPLEVGENEDCSQAVSPAALGTCSCGGLDGEKIRKEESVKAESSGEKNSENQDRMGSSRNETGAAPLISLSSPLVHSSSVSPPSSPLSELCQPLSQTRAELQPHLNDSLLLKQEELYRLTSTDSTSMEASTALATTSVSPLMASSSVGDLYLEKPPEASITEQSQRLSRGDSRGNKLSSVEPKLECFPESLHSQVADPTLTSGQVSGNHNTTFISSGQVMNFSGDVIVVYVSQTPLGDDATEQNDVFRSPVQEEASETAQFFQSCLRSRVDSISQSALQDETLPIQELVE